MNPIIFILAISVIGPVIGSLIGILKKPSKNFIFIMLSFAAGVMLSISFLELIPESIKLSSTLICIIGIFIGALAMHLVDKFIPHIHPGLDSDNPNYELKKTSLYLTLGIFLHNFPEGMAIAIGSVSDMKVSLAIALAIAIHNIPEGICTSAPYYYCTKKRLKSFIISSSTALPILIGFFVAYFLYQNIPTQLVGLIVGATAGLMIYICTDELIPSSSFQLTSHSSIFSFLAGVMLVVLLGEI